MNSTRIKAFLPVLRFPVILSVMAAMLILTEIGIDRVADGINERLYYSGRLEESARFETEANRFFETARLFALGDTTVKESDVTLAMNLMWSRATVMASPSFRTALPENQQDAGFIPEFVMTLPNLEQSVKLLVAGDPQSYAPIEALRQRFTRRLAAFGEQAWNARQLRMAKSVEMNLESIAVLRWIQTGFGIASVLGMIYVLAELFLSRRINRRLNRLVQEKQRMLRTDMLTGISNRFHFEEQLKLLYQNGNTNFSVLYLDLDGFKKVNDDHGHAAGDCLLRHVASCLQSRASSNDVIARFGGDEFAVLLTGTPERAQAFAAEVLERICKSSPSDLPRLTISASAGVCHADQMETDSYPDLMMKRADVALYAAKAAGRNCVRHFSPEMLSEFERRRLVDQELPIAVSQGTLDVAFQPIVSLSDRRVRSVEALVRWTHPQLGALSAQEIVGSAERSNQIQSMTLLMLRKALAFHNVLLAQGHDLTMSVNASPDLFNLETFGPAVAALLYEYRIAAGRLFLEITEDSQLLDTSVVDDNLRILRLSGALLAVDDFGRAFSNVSRLTSLDFRVLKLDKILTDPVATSERARQIIESTDRMAIALGAETVCEGVETEEQALALQRAGIQLAQGYHFGRPMPADDFIGYLARQDVSGSHAVPQASPEA